MLNIKDSIGIEWKKNGSVGRYKLFLFKCVKCIKIVKSRKCYFYKHSGLCRSCSAKITIKTAQLKNRIRPFEARYNNFLNKINDETDLSYENYLEFTKIKNCHYCNKPIPWESYGENTSGFFLDRKDNNIGHLKHNLVVCCGPCNFTKRNYFTYEEFILLSPILKTIQENRSKNEI